MIDGDTSDTRITFKRPSVIFPSVENKPTIVNSSFTYDAGKNQNGVTVESDMVYNICTLLSQQRCKTSFSKGPLFCQISHLTFQGYSCADLYDKSLKESGIYYLQIDGNKYWFLKTYCDMEAAAGGWTVRSVERRER